MTTRATTPKMLPYRRKGDEGNRNPPGASSGGGKSYEFALRGR